MKKYFPSRIISIKKRQTKWRRVTSGEETNLEEYPDSNPDPSDSETHVSVVTGVTWHVEWALNEMIWGT